MVLNRNYILEQIYTAAIQAVDPEKAVARYFQEKKPDLSGFRRIFLAGFGKAGFPMARAVETYLGDRLHQGIIIVKDGHGGTLNTTKIIEASHPDPDARGMEGARSLVDMLASETTSGDLVIVVISGGGSALLPLPAKGISLEDKQKTTGVLLSCGAEIQEINAIRKHISSIKGGQLLRFVNGASVLALILSDVIGDDLPSIASGPAVADPTTYQDCLDIIEFYGIRKTLPKSVYHHLVKGREQGGNSPQETLKPEEFPGDRVQNIIIANNRQALEAAADEAERLGFSPLILSSSLSGDTGDLARFHVALADEIFSSGNPIAPPCCLISGGESTVRLKGTGKGGRNMEFALECASSLDKWKSKPVLFASIGTDGTDGPTDAAGARVSINTLERARELNLSIKDHLSRNDSYNFFKSLENLIITGPTRTNVMDLHIVLIG
jgi:glycerate 2-kinase